MAAFAFATLTATFLVVSGSRTAFPTAVPAVIRSTPVTAGPSEAVIHSAPLDDRAPAVIRSIPVPATEG